MDQLIPLISTIILLLLVIFWVWMFRDMTNSDRLPNRSNAPFNFPPLSKFDWMFVFIILNIFGAVYYYVVEYKNSH